MTEPAETLRAWAVEHEGCGRPKHERIAEAIGKVLEERDRLLVAVGEAEHALEESLEGIPFPKALGPLVRELQRCFGVALRGEALKGEGE